MANPTNIKKSLVSLVLIFIALLVGLYVISKVVLPQLFGGIFNKALTNTINASFENLDFTNAKSLYIDQNLSNSEGMDTSISMNIGKLTIDGNSQGDVVSGQIKYLGEPPAVDFKTDKDKLGLLSITSSDQAGEQVNLHFSEKTDGSLDIGMGAGVIDIDLTKLNIPNLNVGVGAGFAKITFSDRYSTQASLTAGAGKLVINVPSKIERRFTIAQGAGFDDFQVGDDYDKVDDGFQTKGYDQAKVKIDVTIGQALGGFNINLY